MLSFVKKLFGLPTDAEKSAAKVKVAPVKTEVEVGIQKVKTPTKKPAKNPKIAKAKKDSAKKPA